MCVHRSQLRVAPQLTSAQTGIVKCGTVFTVTRHQQVNGRRRLFSPGHGWFSVTNASGFYLWIDDKGFYRRALKDTPIQISSSISSKNITAKDISIAARHEHENTIRLKHGVVIVPQSSVFRVLETKDITSQHSHHGQMTTYTNRRLRLQLGGQGEISGWVPERQRLKHEVPYCKMPHLMEVEPFIDGSAMGPLPSPPGVTPRPGASGWMHKNWVADRFGARHHKNWKKRWFELHNLQLIFSTDAQEAGGQVKGAIDLRKITDIKVSDKTWSEESTKQVAKSGTVLTKANSKALELHQTGGKIWFLHPEPQSSFDAWHEHIRTAIEQARKLQADHDASTAYTHQHDHALSHAHFTSDGIFRQQAIDAMKAGLEANVHRLWTEMHETPDIRRILEVFAQNGKLTPGESAVARAQLLDICSLVGTGAHRARFAAVWQDEHGAALLPLVAQLLQQVPDGPLTATLSEEPESERAEEGVPGASKRASQHRIVEDCIKTAKLSSASTKSRRAAADSQSAQREAIAARRVAERAAASALEKEADLRKRLQAEAEAAQKQAEERAKAEQLRIQEADKAAAEAAESARQAAEEESIRLAAEKTAAEKAVAQLKARESIAAAETARIAAEEAKRREQAEIAARNAEEKARQAEQQAAAKKAAEQERLELEKATAAKAAAEAHAALEAKAQGKAAEEKRIAHQNAVAEAAEKKANAAILAAASMDKQLALASMDRPENKSGAKQHLYQHNDVQDPAQKHGTDTESEPILTLHPDHVAALAPRTDEQVRLDQEAAHAGEMGARLKKANAKVGALTCSLMWNNHNDLDLHCKSPTGSHIFYANRTGTCTGHLDVDMNAKVRNSSNAPIENIMWHNPPKGHYKFWVEAVDMDRSSGKTPFDVRLTKCGQSEDKQFENIEEDDEQVVFEFDM